MKLQCQTCGAHYSIDDSLVGQQGIKAQCPACGNVQVVKPIVPVAGEQGGSPAPATAVPPPLPSTPGKPAAPAAAAREAAEEKKSLAQIKPEMETAREARCERCGMVLPAGQGGPLCLRCRDLVEEQLAAGQDDRLWRVKKNDGVVLGPLTLEEVRQKFREEEISAADQVAQGEGQFRLISSYPEFADFFRRPGQALEMTFRHPPASGWRWPLLLVLLVLLAGGILATWYFLKQGDEIGDAAGPMDEIIDLFASKVSNPQGDAAQLRAKARQLMKRDDRLSYLRADKLLMTAVLLQPDDIEAATMWLENRALLDTLAPDAVMRKVALDLADELARRYPADTRVKLGRGFLAVVLGKFIQARRLADEVLSEQENNVDAMLLKALSLLDSSTKIAVGQLRAILKQDDSYRIAERMLARAYQRLGNFRKSLAFLQRRLKRDPSQVDILNAVGQLYLDVGHYREALESFDTVLAAEPGNVEAALRIAGVHAQLLGRPRQGIKVLQSVLDGEGKLPASGRARLLAGLSVCQRLVGKVKQARQSAEKALKIDPACVPAGLSLAILDQQQRQVSPALQRLLQLRAHLPDSAHLQARIGEVWSMVPDMRKATAAVKQAVEMASRDMAVGLLAAGFFLFLDDLDQAYAWLKLLTDRDFLHWQQHRRISEYYDDDSLLGRTVERVQQAAHKYDSDPLVLSLAGLVLVQANKYQAAQRLLRLALELDSDCFSANLVLGWLEYRRGNWRRALAFLADASRLRQSSSQARILRGYSLLKLGRAGEAAAQFRAVLQFDMASRTARAGLAAALAARGRKKKAISMPLEILKTDHRNVFVKSLLFDLGH